MIRDGDISYVDFALYMKSYLRYLPSSLTEKPIDVRCNEEALRIKAINIIFIRPDLIHHFLSKDVLIDEEAEALLSYFLNGSKPSAATVINKKRFEHMPIKSKRKIVDLINTLPYDTSEGLLSPAITVGELEALLTTGDCQHNYICNNQAQLSHLFYQMAKSELLDKANYLQVICQHNRLWNHERERKGTTYPSKPLTPGNFTSSHGQIVSKKDEYDAIDNTILSIAE